MESTGQIEIRIEGFDGSFPITPENYDIRDIRDMLLNIEDLLYPEDKRKRPKIAYRVESGSVRHIFTTTLQAIIAINAIIQSIQSKQSIEHLEPRTASAIERLQTIALEKDVIVTLYTSLTETQTLTINNKTQYFRQETERVQSEFYLYGKVTNAGGKDKANIHLSTKDRGTLRIQTPIAILEEHEINILYKSIGIRAKGFQHPITGDLDTSELSFIEFVDYAPSFNSDYLNHLREKATTSWLGNIDTDTWLHELRGSYES